MDFDKRCIHRFDGGKQNGKICGRKVSKKDPEQYYCAEHRICVWVVSGERSQTVKPSEEKYLDFETFTASLIV